MDRYCALARQLKLTCPDLAVLEHEPMARHTSFRVGGPARLMALPERREQLLAAVACARALEITPFFLGNGTNLLVADRGYEGFVLKLCARDGKGELSAIGAEEGVLTAGGGALLSRLSCRAMELGLSGLEFAQGIPGSVGGAVTMNAGAYGGEIAQVLAWAEVLTPGGGVERVDGAECAFSYRSSAFSDGTRPILRAAFRLEKGDRAAIRARMEELAAARREKQPLDYPSAGSTFKRPASGFAAALIDGCGLKGTAIGGAQVSEKHAGFLINRGGATASDILALAGLVRETVKRAQGVELELEIRTLGF